MKGGDDLSRKKKSSENSFLGRILIFIKPFWKTIKDKRIFHTLFERQKRLACYTDKKSVEESRLSYGFGIARIVSAVLLVLLLLITVLFGSGAVSYEKVYYMFKDISYIKSYGESEPSSLSYSRPVQNQVFTSFKGGLAVAGDSEIKLFTSTGRVTMSIGSEFTNPRLSSSDSHLLIYDQGSSTYSVYNSFICVLTEKLDFPISYADMADNGSFLVITQSSMYDSVVRIYDQTFELVSEYSKNDRVISAALSSDGRFAAVLSMTADHGESVVSLNVVDCKKNEVISTSFFNGSMPYRCAFLSDDRVAVILDDRACVIDRGGKVRGQYLYTSTLERIDVSDDGYALLFSETKTTQGKTVALFDKEGKLIFGDTVKGNVRDVKIGDGVIYLLQSGKVIRIYTRIGTENVSQISDAGLALVVFPDGKVAVCTQTAASYISFD